MRKLHILFILLIGLVIYTLMWMESMPSFYRPEFTSFWWNNARVTSKTAPQNDSHKLIDLENFEYLIDQPCDNSNASNAIVLVHSAPNNWNERKVIRETWGQAVPANRIRFVLAATDDSFVQTQIGQENKEFNDIIQGNFHDNYRNMTYKHAMVLKWFADHCPKLKYLIKIDDDVFLNTLMVFDFLEQNSVEDQNLILCDPIKDNPVIRDNQSKWYVSFEEYSGRFFPSPHCSGFIIIYSNDVARKLYKEAQRHKYFWIDDVHLTGTVRQFTNVNITEIGKYYIHDSIVDDLISGRIDLKDVELVFLVGEFDLSEQRMRKMWEIVSSAQV